MDICPLDNGNYYIHISKEELAKTNDIADIIETLPHPAYFEIFDSDGGALVFARQRDGSPVCFEFDDIERVIDAAKTCPDDTISFLAHDTGRYKLIIYPWRSDAPPLGMSEFSDPVPAHPDLTRHMGEQGGMLLGPEAVRELNRIFR